MAQQADINLFKAKTGLSAQTIVLAKRLRLIGTVFLIIVCVVGAISAGIFYLLDTQLKDLESQKVIALKRISSQAKKEELLSEVKKRSDSVSQILTSQLPWSASIGYIQSFVKPPLLTSFSGDESKSVHVMVKGNSIDEVIPVVQGAIKQTMVKHFQKSTLESVTVAKDGSVLLTFAFALGTAL